jgi:DNA-binding Xre family transcriptional regulator
MDASEVRDHVIFLSSKGIGLGAIANQVGTQRSTIQYIKKGKYEKISVTLGKKILAVPAVPRERMAYTSTKPILDLLEQLNKKGVSSKDVGRALGCRYGTLIVKNKMRVWRFQQVEAVCRDMLRRLP